MELILKKPIEELIPAMIAFNNEELVKEIKQKLEVYKSKVYTENDIAEAKTDRASLNKFKDAIEDERKRIKKLYLQPYEKFEGQIKEMTALIDDSSRTIDNQVKSFEEAEKEAKKIKILDFWKANCDALIDIVNFRINEQWLNKGYAMSKIEDEITKLIIQINNDLIVIKSFHFKQESHLIDYYLNNNFNLTLTLQEKTRIEESEKKLAEFQQKQTQAELERKQQVAQVKVELEVKPEEPIKQVDFRVWATQVQLNAIKNFLIENKIKYGGVK